MAETPNSSPRSALVVRGGWEGHQPVETTDAIIPFLESNSFTVRVEGSPAVYADRDYMDGVDLIVQSNTMGTIDYPEVEGLRRAVSAGTGFGGWHGGMVDAYRDSPDYLQLVGAQFAHHSAIAPEKRTGVNADFYTPYTVQMTEAGKTHPITEGIDDFDLVSEHYWLLSDDYNDVLATTTQSVRAWDDWNRPVTSPSVWTRQWGKGRVFVSAPGHRLDIIENPSVRTIIERGLLWAAR